jgi:hypothetical protein
LSDVKDHHVVAKMLKQFFEELPEPLLTFQLYDKFLHWIGIEFSWNFLKLAEIEDPEFRVVAGSSLLYALPPMNRKVLLFMLDFFRLLTPEDTLRESSTSRSYCASAFGYIFLRNEQNDAKTLSKHNIDRKQACIKIIDSLLLLQQDLVRKFPRNFLYCEIVLDTDDIKFNKDTFLVRAATVRNIVEKSLDEYYNGNFLSFFSN